MRLQLLLEAGTPQAVLQRPTNVIPACTEVNVRVVLLTTLRRRRSVVRRCSAVASGNGTQAAAAVTTTAATNAAVGTWYLAVESTRWEGAVPVAAGTTADRSVRGGGVGWISGWSVRVVTIIASI